MNIATITQPLKQTLFNLRGIILIISLISLIVFSWMLREKTVLNTDTSWFLYSTAQWLSGKRLYIDIVEVNPPLAFFLTYPVIFVAKSLHLNPATVFTFAVFIFSLISLSLAAGILYRVLEQRQIISGMFLLASAFVMLVLPGWDFGEREHLTLIFILPYVLLLGARHAGIRINPWLAGAIGLIAAVGFGLKPYFLITPLLLEVSLLYRTRRLFSVFRPETIILSATIILYILSIFLVTPEYIKYIMPMAMTVYDFGFKNHFLEVLAGALPVILLIIVLPFLKVKSGQVENDIVWVLFLAAVGFLLAFIIQMKGWLYHLYPALSLSLLVVFLKLSLTEFNIRQKSVFAQLYAFVHIIFYATLGVFLAPKMHVIVKEIMSSPVLRNQNINSFASISTDIAVNFPLVNERCLYYPLRFPSLWPLPGALRAEYILKTLPRSSDAKNIDIEKIKKIKNYVRAAVIEDLTRYPPDIIVVDYRMRLKGTDIKPNLLNFFLKDPGFAELWRHYHYVGTINIDTGKIKTSGKIEIYRRKNQEETYKKRITSCFHKEE